jgi:hypothetical protein
MEDRKLHIVCHDVPYPPDYGGVFDLYYKIRTLHEQGIQILLHCFTSGREEQPILKTLCEQVFHTSFLISFAPVPIPNYWNGFYRMNIRFCSKVFTVLISRRTAVLHTGKFYSGYTTLNPSTTNNLQKAVPPGSKNYITCVKVSCSESMNVKLPPAGHS